MNKYIVLVLFVVLSACNYKPRCQKHYIHEGFTGRVSIVFEQKDGQGWIDNGGCIVYSIPSNGKCKSALRFKAESGYANDTYRFYEVVKGDSASFRIMEFSEAEYLQDTIQNRYRKYIFYFSSGFFNGNYSWEYDVDYGMNYKKHLYY